VVEGIAEHLVSSAMRVMGELSHDFASEDDILNIGCLQKIASHFIIGV
jgi:hypothetical protein